MSTSIYILISILFSVLVGLIVYIFLKKDNDKKAYDHELEMKELEFLFNDYKTETDNIVRDYETYITNLQAYYHNLTEIIRVSDDKIHNIDIKGAFKADDDIGFFFKNIKEIQDILNGFDFSKPLINKEIVKENPVQIQGPILPDGKSNVIVISQEQAQEIADKIK